MDTLSFQTFFLSDDFPVGITKSGTLYMVSCENAQNLPTLIFFLNEKRFALDCNSNLKLIIRYGLCNQK